MDYNLETNYRANLKEAICLLSKQLNSAIKAAARPNIVLTQTLNSILEELQISSHKRSMN